MRLEIINMGGVFLDWSEKIKKEAKCNTPENLNAFRTICEKGFLVFENGCILPHPYYSKKGKEGPARFRGDKASISLFKQKPSEDKAKNEDNWPTTIEMTHLCHQSSCMNPEHLIYEPRWKNWKRLYCFGCDCNVEPPCLGKFRPASYWEDEKNRPPVLGYDSMKKLKSVLPGNVKVLLKDHFRKDDLKAGNRLKRLKRKKKHDRQAKRKKLKR